MLIAGVANVVTQNPPIAAIIILKVTSTFRSFISLVRLGRIADNGVFTIVYPVLTKLNVIKAYITFFSSLSKSGI